MYYIIYKTTNLINQKFYIGKHQTKNLNDNYLGSGNLLLKAIKKYGRKNFTKEILFQCSSLEELNNKEKEIVNEDIINDVLSYNIKIGGEGGWDHWHRREEEAKLSRQKGGRNSGVLERNLALSKEEKYRRYSIGLKNYDHSKTEYTYWSKPENREKQRIRMLTQNKMRGKIWIYNSELNETKLIEKDELKEYESIGWNTGKKYKKTSSSGYNRRWVYKDGVNKSIFKWELDEYLNSGWSRGRLWKIVKK